MDLRKAITVTPLRKIPVLGGDVLHAIKSSDNEFVGFGEAYFSLIENKMIKGWKKHNVMTMNVIVPVGEVKFVFYDPENEEFRTEVIGSKCYNRITVLPGTWVAFQGLSESRNLILNIASILHDPNEADICDLQDFNFNWE